MFFFCILGYSKHIIFSWKSHTFGVTDDFLCDFWWFCWLGLGNPRHIATKTPLEKLNQNLGLADKLGQKTKFFQWVEGSPKQIKENLILKFLILCTMKLFWLISFVLTILCWCVEDSGMRPTYLMFVRKFRITKHLQLKGRAPAIVSVE